MPVLAQHSAASVEHGTPHEVVALARHVLGTIDVDPFSSEYWNRHVVHARQYIDEEGDALDPDWSWKGDSTFFINPPGGLVKRAFDFALRRYLEGSAVFWTGFNLEQLSYLQALGVMFPGFRRIIPPRRLAFLQSRRDAVRSLLEKARRADEDGFIKRCLRLRAQAAELELDLDGPPVPGTAPTHSNYLLLMPSTNEQIERFDEACALMPAEVF